MKAKSGPRITTSSAKQSFRAAVKASPRSFIHASLIREMRSRTAICSCVMPDGSAMEISRMKAYPSLLLIHHRLFLFIARSGWRCYAADINAEGLTPINTDTPIHRYTDTPIRLTCGGDHLVHAFVLSSYPCFIGVI